LRLSHGCELVIIYQRNGSEPCFPIASYGSTALPRRLDILFPFLSSTSPLEMMFLNATESLTIVAMACKVKNQPRVWSTPSAMKSAGKREAPPQPSPRGRELRTVLIFESTASMLL